MTRTTRGLLLGLSLALVAPAASAEFYKWTDANGILHFTANLDEVPPSQRPGAAAATGGTGSFQRIESGARSAPSARSRAVPSDTAATPDGAAKVAPSEERYGGRSEAQWRAEFRKYRDAIQSLEPVAERCKGDRFRWTEGAGKRKWQEETDEAQACSRVNNELDINRRALESLEEKAHRAGVPPGWVRD
jgi:hypothetical protein